MILRARQGADTTGVAMKTIIEPFKIKSVEPIHFTTREEREAVLRKGFYNLFMIRAEDVLIDLLTAWLDPRLQHG